MRALEYIIFEAGGEAYGLEAQDIKEIIRAKDIRLNKVPKTPSYIRGLMNLRGEILPVVHLQERFAYSKHQSKNLPLEIGEKEIDTRSEAHIEVMPKRLVVAKVKHYYIGLLVDRIIGHMLTNEADFLLPTEPMQVATPYIKGLIVSEEQSFFVLNVEKLECREWEHA